jgi:hypothetical protein
MFMALQIARTREHIARTAFSSELAEFTEERPPSHEIVRKFIAERHGHTPDEPEIEAAWTLATYEMQESVASFETAFGVSIKIATTQMSPLLDGMHWRVETVDEPVLWTCDRPVMPWGPPSPRDRFRGVGYGNADEIRMPLNPTAMLILERCASLSPKGSRRADFMSTTWTSLCSAMSLLYALLGDEHDWTSCSWPLIGRPSDST